MNYRAVYLLTLSLTLALTLALCNAWHVESSAQSQNWRTTAREESQKLCSAAQNLLRSNNEKKTSPVKRSQNIELASSMLGRAIARDPSDPLPYYLNSLCLNMQGKYEQSLDLLKTAYRLNPEEHEVLLSTAITQYLAGSYERAINLYGRLFESKMDKGALSAGIGFCYLRQGKLDKALESFENSKSSAIAHPLAYQGLALVHYLKGDLQKAKQYANHGLSIESYPPFHLLLARISYMEGNFSSAKKHMSIWGKLTRKLPVSRSMTKIGFSGQHDFYFDPFSIDEYDNDAAMQARYTCSLTQDKRRLSLARKAKTAENIARIDSRLAQCIDDHHLLRERAFMELASAKFLPAADTLKKTLQKAPACKIDFLDLGQALSRNGQAKQAQELIKTYKKLYPSQNLADVYASILTMEQKEEKPSDSKSGERLLPGEGPQSESKKKENPDESPF